MIHEEMRLNIEWLRQRYLEGSLDPAALIESLRKRCEAYRHKNIWITLLSEADVQPYIEALATKAIESHPLWGIPFAIKDNIDLAGIPTTAACEGLNTIPHEHAIVVKHLIDAGAIPLGKTNMDQLATGLVGMRSPEPWGECLNAFDDNYISGGSSSGSAVAVSLDLVSFALGTDTAGSGRIPAALNNIVGLKPSKGLLSTRGVLPACRSLDCVSIFAKSIEDISTVFDAALHYDEHDPYARKNCFENSHRNRGKVSGKIKIAVFHEEQLEFYGNTAVTDAFSNAIAQWKGLQSVDVEFSTIDFTPFKEAAALLYSGPWVAERKWVLKALEDESAIKLLPVIDDIINSKGYDAVDTFDAMYRLKSLKIRCDKLLENLDAVMSPTAPSAFTREQVRQAPIALNTQLGHYTNFMNLLDYCAISLPYRDRLLPVPNGFTLFSRAKKDQLLLSLANHWSNPQDSADQGSEYHESDSILLAVCGAHLQGEALNWQLLERGATLVRATQTHASYKLYALPDGKRPALVRDSDGGTAIEIEIWRMPSAAFASFVVGIAAPLGIGKIQCRAGDWVPGFVCEEGGIESATDITQFGAWRAYKHQENKS